MSTNLLPLPPLPQPTAQMVNPATGMITQPWFQYLKRVDDHIRDIERRLAAGGL